jgi:hypothetical protein
MRHLNLFYIIIFSLSSYTSKSQSGVSNIDTLLVGNWKGTSICQVKNSPCHDEVVVYHLSKNKGVDTFYINASKIVNGQEEEMGVVPCIYNQKKNQLTSTAYNSEWTFNIKDAKLEGTLIFHGSLYRVIEVTKQY